jgi:hypothetical protein
MWNQPVEQRESADFIIYGQALSHPAARNREANNVRDGR